MIELNPLEVRLAQTFNPLMIWLLFLVTRTLVSLSTSCWVNNIVENSFHSENSRVFEALSGTRDKDRVYPSLYHTGLFDQVTAAPYISHSKANTSNTLEEISYRLSQRNDHPW